MERWICGFALLTWRCDTCARRNRSSMSRSSRHPCCPGCLRSREPCASASRWLPRYPRVWRLFARFIIAIASAFLLLRSVAGFPPFWQQACTSWFVPSWRPSSVWSASVASPRAARRCSISRRFRLRFPLRFLLDRVAAVTIHHSGRKNSQGKSAGIRLGQHRRVVFLFL